MKKTIAIIGGTGKLESFVAAKLCFAGYHILLVDKDTEGLKAIYEAIVSKHPEGIEMIGCFYECSWEGDIIIMGLGNASAEEIANKIKTVVTNKIVIGLTCGKEHERSMLASIKKNIATFQICFS